MTLTTILLLKKWLIAPTIAKAESRRGGGYGGRTARSSSFSQIGAVKCRAQDLRIRVAENPRLYRHGEFVISVCEVHCSLFPRGL